jgi:hypothetical protein
VRDAETEPRSHQLAEEVLTPLGAGAGHQSDVERHLRQGTSGVAAEQPLAFQLGEQLRPLCSQPTQQRRDVDLGQDEAQLALGPVEIERSSEDHHHALRQLDALLGQAVPQRSPRTAPALHVERGDATPGAIPAGAFVLGVDQAQVEVARAMIRHLADFAADPKVAVPGKGLVQCAFDLLVDAADGMNPSSVLPLLPGGRGPEIRVGGLGRSFGIEELTGSAGHRRHPTDVLSGHHPMPGDGTIDDDGESARWPRHGP